MLELVDTSTIVLDAEGCECYRFDDHYQRCVKDESWFYLQQEEERLLLLDGNTLPPASTVSHKNNIQKIMFDCGIMRPNMEQGFDGHIACNAIVKTVAAKKSSKHRPKGTMEIKTLNVDTNVYTEFMTGDGMFIDTLREKTSELYEHVTIQHDNAPAHTKFCKQPICKQVCSTGTPTITIVFQPSNSPDLNLLDLCMFSGMKCRSSSLKGQCHCSLESFIDIIKEVYHSYSPESIERVIGVQMEVFRNILLTRGSNIYKLHSKVRRLGVNLLVPVAVVEGAVGWVNEILPAGEHFAYSRGVLAGVDAVPRAQPPPSPPTAAAAAAAVSIYDAGDDIIPELDLQEMMDELTGGLVTSFTVFSEDSDDEADYTVY